MSETLEQIEARLGRPLTPDEEHLLSEDPDAFADGGAEYDDDFGADWFPETSS